MAAQLFVIGALVLTAYWAGWWIGRGDGWREAIRWRNQVDGMAQLIDAARVDEPGSPTLN